MTNNATFTSRPIPSNNNTRPLIVAGLSLRSAKSFEERVECAAAAGFVNIGLDLGSFKTFQEQGLTFSKMHRILNGSGVRLVELEVVLGFDATPSELANSPVPGSGYTTRDNEKVLFELAESFGVRHLQVIGAFSGELRATSAEALGALCDRAAQYGVMVSLEFVPGTTVPDAGVALDLITKAGRSNAGICIDVWHHFRGANDWRLIEDIPAERISLIQLSDGPTHPESGDFIFDTLHNRVLPGHGDFDLERFFELLSSKGVTAPVSIEILSDAVDSLGPSEAAKGMHSTSLPFAKI